MSLPIFLKKYFWDTDFQKFDGDEYPLFVIERVLEYGDENAIGWVQKNFVRDLIEDAIRTRKGITPKSANYWALIYNIPKNKVACLKMLSQKKLAKTWNY